MEQKASFDDPASVSEVTNGQAEQLFEQL